MNRFAIAKIAFCKPAGMRSDSTCFALCGSIRSIDRSSRTTLPERRRDKITSAAEIYWEMMLASATPAAAKWQTMTKNRFSRMLMTPAIERK